MNRIARFINNDQGADLIEYALLIGLITLAAVGSLTSIGTNISGLWERISTKLGTTAAGIQ
jgi:pilus assembly protein Flp/PilA